MSTDHTAESFPGSDRGFQLGETSVPLHANPAPVSDAVGDGLESLRTPSETFVGIDASVTGDVPDPAQPAAVEFRVTSPGRPNRRLRLTGSRYTFGNAEGCSIRLSDLALRPMHAVLIRDAARILIRAYSVPVLVNGQRKTESTLQPGDVLELGNYRFELLPTHNQTAHTQLDPELATAPRSVLEPPVLSRPDHTHSALNPDAAASLNSASTGTEVTGTESTGTETTGTERPDGFTDRLGQQAVPSADDLLWRERLRREVDQWRDRQDECDRRENRCDEREADLRSRESELWTRAENLYRREARLQSQEAAAFQLYDEFTQRQQELLRLREEAQNRQESFNRREAEFRNIEFEYRHRLEDAARQLHQSQQQAETATQSVQRMRAQFESLNRQIEDLSSQQQDIDLREQQQRDEYERVREQLEQARDEAVERSSESDSRRRDAEMRLEEMAAQLVSLREDEDADLKSQRQQLQQSEQLVEELREQVAQLQQSVDEASRQSDQYRNDYEQAKQSVQQLESLVAQSADRGEQDRESWAIETDELRSSIEQLSVELARANGELSELRLANENLTNRLDEIQIERDQAREDLESRPSNEQVESLQSELQSTSTQLSQLRDDYQQTLGELEQTQREHEERERQWAEEKLVSAAPQVSAESNPSDEVSEWDVPENPVDAVAPSETDPKAIESELQSAWETDEDTPRKDADSEPSVETAASVSDSDESSVSDSDESQFLAVAEDEAQADRPETTSVWEQAGPQWESPQNEDQAASIEDSNIDASADEAAGLSTESLQQEEADSSTDSLWPSNPSIEDPNPEQHEITPLSPAENAHPASMWPSDEAPADIESANATQPGSEDETFADTQSPAEAIWPTAEAQTQHADAIDGESASEPLAATDAVDADVPEPLESDGQTMRWQPDGEEIVANDPQLADSEDHSDSHNEEVESTYAWQQSQPWGDDHSAPTPTGDANDFENEAVPSGDLSQDANQATWGTAPEQDAAEAEHSVADPVEANPSSAWDQESNGWDLEPPALQTPDSIDESNPDAPQSDALSASPSLAGDLEPTDSPNDSPNWDASSSESFDSLTDGSSQVEPEEASADATGDPIVDGSLASMLIEDFENESRASIEDRPTNAGIDAPETGWSDANASIESDSPNSIGSSSIESSAIESRAIESSDVEHGATAQWDSSNQNWDQEHSEELYASDWSNNAEGYRVEDVESHGPLDEMANDSIEPEEHDDFASESAELGQEEMSNEASDLATYDEQSPEQQNADEQNGDEQNLEEQNLDSSVTEQLDQPPSAEGSDEEEDDSIEAYMNRLLQRVQAPGNDDATTTASISSSSDATGSLDGLTDLVETQTEQEELEEIDPSAPLVPRSQAPEKTADLTALRALANQTARNAITRSVRVQTRDIQLKGMVSFACAGGAIVCGLACFLFLPGVIRFVAVAMTLIVAAVYSREGIQLLLEANSRIRAAESKTSAEVAEGAEDEVSASADAVTGDVETDAGTDDSDE